MDYDEKFNPLIDCLKNGTLTDEARKLISEIRYEDAIAIREKFGADFPSNPALDEIGKQFDVTRKRIREIEAKALRKLRERDNDPNGNGPSAA